MTTDEQGGLQFVERDGKYFITGGTDGDVEISKDAYERLMGNIPDGATVVTQTYKKDEED